jgi:gliding motility-associated-like protein
MFFKRPIPIMLTAVCLLAACKKETKGGGTGIILGEYLHLSADSLCVQAPNIFTPNGDGMDDVFWIPCRNAASFSLTIRNAAADVIFSTTSQQEVWEGIDPTVNDSLPTAGRYHYTVHVTGTSGAQLSGNAEVYVVPDPATPCFSSLVPPVFGDEFDPRICGIAYTSNDVVCLW